MDLAIEVEEKAIARQVLVRARFVTWNNCPKEEALYAAKVAETKAAAKEAVAATKAVVDAE